MNETSSDKRYVIAGSELFTQFGKLYTLGYYFQYPPGANDSNVMYASHN